MEITGSSREAQPSWLPLIPIRLMARGQGMGWVVVSPFSGEHVTASLEALTLVLLIRNLFSQRPLDLFGSGHSRPVSHLSNLLLL